VSGDVINLTGSSTLTIDFNDSSKLYEITIPTCSYRMGVPQMGYGAAVVGKCSVQAVLSRHTALSTESTDMKVG